MNKEMKTENLSESHQLAMDTLDLKPTKGIGSADIHMMDHQHIERLAGVEPGAYVKNPDEVYLGMQHAVGTCFIDQFLPRNPLSMGDAGYESDSDRKDTATTGAKEIILDGMVIDSPEAVAEHLEKYRFPKIRKKIAEFDEDAEVAKLIAHERNIQKKFGPSILKAPYGMVIFPVLRNYDYGYENYFMAYMLYPELMEKDFSIRADFGVVKNRAIARAYVEGNLPRFYRLDYDMADSRSMLIDIKTLDKLWFPHFARSIEPLQKAGIKLIWHCDGNLMEMVPRLLDVGLCGFQGFQYECGMDYEKICKMKTKEGDDLIIMGGVSVTTTLPHGTPDDVRKEMKWLVDNGPKTGLFLSNSSSIAPGVPWENIEAFVEGLKYYREHGRG